MFRPRVWRSVDGKGRQNEDEQFFLTPKGYGRKAVKLSTDTVTWIYMTSDGGLKPENSFMELVKHLPPHVQLVNTDNAARLTLEASR